MPAYRVEVCWENTSVDYGWVHVIANNMDEARARAIAKARDGDWDPKSEVTSGGELYTERIAEL